MSDFPIPPPPGLDLTADRTPELYVAYIVPYSIAIIAVVLRVISRRAGKTGFWWDDYLLLFATLLGTCYLALGLQLIAEPGFGRHVWVVGYDHLVVDMKIFFAGEFFYTGILLCLNLSLLALYWRIFNVSKLRFFIWAMAGVLACWYIASTTMALVQCHPISKLWDIFAPGYCSNSAGFYFGGALTHTLLDVLLLMLPLPCIWHLQITNVQKILLTGVFTVGCSTIVFSSLRLWELLQVDTASVDLTWNFVDTIIYSALEINVSIIACCIPTLRPILRYFRTGSFVRSERSGQLHSPSRPDSMISSVAQRQQNEDLEQNEFGEAQEHGYSGHPLRKVPSSTASSTLYPAHSTVGDPNDVGLFAQLEKEGSNPGARLPGASKKWDI